VAAISLFSDSTTDCRINTQLLQPGDAAQIADAIERLLGDPTFARAMGDRARTRVMSIFSLDAQAEMITKRILAALDGDGSDPHDPPVADREKSSP